MPDDRCEGQLYPVTGGVARGFSGPERAENPGALDARASTVHTGAVMNERKNGEGRAMEDRAQVEKMVEAAQETKAEDLFLYDMQNRSTITDFVLICSGRSQAHVRGIADKIEAKLKKAGVRCSSVEGYQEGSWVLLDYGIAIVHVFHPETRAYYDLESLLESFPCTRPVSVSPPQDQAGIPA